MEKVEAPVIIWNDYNLNPPLRIFQKKSRNFFDNKKRSSCSLPIEKMSKYSGENLFRLILCNILQKKLEKIGAKNLEKLRKMNFRKNWITRKITSWWFLPTFPEEKGSISSVGVIREIGEQTFVAFQRL